jgi:hypothetical protein
MPATSVPRTPIEPCCDRMKQYRLSLVEIDLEGYLHIAGIRIFFCPWCGEDLLGLGRPIGTNEAGQ